MVRSPLPHRRLGALLLVNARAPVSDLLVLHDLDSYARITYAGVETLIVAPILMIAT